MPEATQPWPLATIECLSSVGPSSNWSGLTITEAIPGAAAYAVIGAK